MGKGGRGFRAGVGQGEGVVKEGWRDGSCRSREGGVIGLEERGTGDRVFWTGVREGEGVEEGWRDGSRKSREGAVRGLRKGEQGVGFLDRGRVGGREGGVEGEEVWRDGSRSREGRVRGLEERGTGGRGFGGRGRVGGREGWKGRRDGGMEAGSLGGRGKGS